MWERYGQLAKKIVGRALDSFGALLLEHEIPVADAQAGDAYFSPTPGTEAARAHLGWLDRITRAPCLLELFQRTPGPIDTRDTVRKQLTLDHALALDAKKRKIERPPLLHVWIITSGRPRQVLEGYGFAPARRWPSGFWVRQRLDGLGVVVLNEVPRRRDTLLLRLLGRGRVLAEAIADLQALPPSAKEREVALPPLIALRFEVTQDPSPDEETREFLMATENLYEQWEKRTERRGEAKGLAKGEAKGLAKGEAKGEAKGLAKGLTQSLVSTYQERFGPIPPAVRDALATVVTPEAIGRWVILFASASAKEIAAAVRRGEPTR